VGASIIGAITATISQGTSVSGTLNVIETGTWNVSVTGRRYYCK
jgi:hypothetical protein